MIFDYSSPSHHYRSIALARMLPALFVIGGLTISVIDPTEATADTTALEEVLVSGTADPRFGSLLTSTEVRSISQEEQVTLPLSPASLAEALPGVALNGQGGLFQSYSLRGFSRWRIRTEISGVPILTDRRAGNSLSFLPPGLIDSIRVNMGPGSSLYGSGAMGGVMNVSLDRPNATTLSVGLSSMGEARDILLKTAISDQTSIATTIRRASDSTSGGGTRLNTGYDQSTLYVSDKTYIGETAISSEVLLSNGSAIGKSSALYPADRITNYPTDNHRLLNFRVTTPNQWFMQAYAHSQNWRSLTQRADDSRNTSIYSSKTIGGLISRSLSATQFSQQYGLDITRRYQVDITEQTENSDVPGLPYNVLDDGSEWTAGLFWERTWFWDSFSLQGGLRADRAEAQSSSASANHSDINVQMKADWVLTSAWRLSTELGSAYRLPTLSELYFEGETPRGRLVGNETLRNEETVGAQVTLVYDTDDILFEITASANTVDDYIERTLLSPGIETYRNLKSGDLWGIDGQLQRRDARIEHTLSWQWQQGESADGDIIADLPPPSIRYAASWQRADYSLGMDLRYRFSRERYGPGELPVGGAAILGLSAQRRVNRHWTVEASITNALDRHYRTSASENAPFDIGRAINLRIDWRP